jgi:hypothetical protein
MSCLKGSVHIMADFLMSPRDTVLGRLCIETRGGVDSIEIAVPTKKKKTTWNYCSIWSTCFWCPQGDTVYRDNTKARGYAKYISLINSERKPGERLLGTAQVNRFLG